MTTAKLTESSSYLDFALESQDLVNNLVDLFLNDMGTDELVEACISRLKKYLEVIKSDENKIKNIFKVSSEEELQAAFQKFYSTSGLTAWTGINLEENFLQAYRILVDEDMREMQQYLDSVIRPAMIATIKKEGVDVTKETAGKILNDSLKDLYISLNLTTGRVVRTRSEKPIDLKGTTSESIRILADRLTREQFRRVKELKNYAKEHGNPTVVGGVKIDGSQVVLTIQSDWYDLTQHGMTASEAEKKLSPQKRVSINNKLIDSMVSHLNGSYSTIAKEYIKRYILKGNMASTVFFVGRNTNQIGGLLGEIGAIITISELLKGVNQEKIMDWTAQHRVGGKDLSLDIILRDIAGIDVGIQVKNSILDLEVPEINIDFASANSDFLLSKLQQAYGYNFKDLETIFESEVFNVPAKPFGNTWREVGINTQYKNGAPINWEIFVQGYELMQEIISYTKTFLTSFAPDFLYMAGGQQFTSQLATLDNTLSTGLITGNSLYIVRTTPYFVSGRLEKIINDLEQLQQLQQQAAHFNLINSLGTVGKGKNKVSYNYVWYRNNNKHDLNRKSRTTASLLFD